MTFDNFFDIIKTIPPLTIEVNGEVCKVLTTFINTNRKASLVLEKDVVVFEGEPVEIESTELFLCDVQNAKLISEPPKQLSSIISGDKISFSKVNCPEIKASSVQDDVFKDMLLVGEENRMLLKCTTIELAVVSAPHLGLSPQDTEKYLSEGVTAFGVLPHVKELFITGKISMQAVLDPLNNKNKNEAEECFKKYMDSLENYLSSLSVVNLIKC